MWDDALTQLYSAVGGTEMRGRQSGREMWDNIRAISAKNGDSLPKQDSLHSHLPSSSVIDLSSYLVFPNWPSDSKNNKNSSNTRKHLPSPHCEPTYATTLHILSSLTLP